MWSVRGWFLVQKLDQVWFFCSCALCATVVASERVRELHGAVPSRVLGILGYIVGLTKPDCVSLLELVLKHTDTVD